MLAWTYQPNLEADLNFLIPSCAYSKLTSIRDINTCNYVKILILLYWFIDLLY
jgi:hypothetical protein